MADYEALRQIERIESLVHQLECTPDVAAQAVARELVEAVLELNRAGLARLLTYLTQAGEQSRNALLAAADEPLIGHLLMLHGLHPTDLITRVQQAIADIRGQLPATDIEIVEASLEAVRVVFHAPDDPAEFMALQRRLEQTILCAIPDVARVECLPRPEAEPRSYRPLPVIAASSRLPT